MSYTPYTTPKPSPTPPLLQLGPQRRLLTGLFVSLLRQHFAEPDQVMDPAARDLTWTPDPMTTGILIESVAKWDPTTVDVKPALYVKAGDWTNVRVSLNDQIQSTLGPGSAEQYAIRVVGSHSVLAVAGAMGGDEAEIVGGEAWSYLTAVAPKLREGLPTLFAKLRVAQLGAPFIVEESQQHLAVPVPIAYELQKTWAIRSDSPLFARLALAVNVSLNQT